MPDPANMFLAQRLLWCASDINRDPLIPLHVPATTVAFLHRIVKTSKGLPEFMLVQGHSALKDEIVRVLLPKSAQALRADHERRQREKEDALRDQDFERAASLRDATDSTRAQIKQLADTDVEPHHFVEAIRNLGFDGSLDA